MISELVTGLLKKRLAIATEIYDLMRDRYDTGSIHFNVVRDARIEVFHARLELSETNDDRIKVLQELVKAAEEMLARSKRDEAEGRIGVLQAESQLLKAKIALENEKTPK
jgi:outer membrane protein TolC